MYAVEGLVVYMLLTSENWMLAKTIDAKFVITPFMVANNNVRGHLGRI